MNAKHLIPLAALAAVGVVTTAWTLRTGTPTVASDRRGETVLPALLAKGNDVTVVTVRDSTGTFTAERRGNGFVAADSGYPVKSETARDILASSAELAFEEIRTANPGRYGELGLADPDSKEAGKDGKDASGREITFRTAGGELAGIVIGKPDSTASGTAGGVFVRVKGEAQTFLARGSVRLPSARTDWYVPVDLDVKRKDVKKIELSGGGRDGLTAAAPDDKPGTLVLADVPENRTAEAFKVSRLTTVVESFTFQDVRKATKPADDARRMAVDAGSGLRLTLVSLGDGWVQITAEASEDGAKDKAKAIASKVDGYDFRLPSNLAEVLGWTMADVASEKKEPAASEKKEPQEGGRLRLPFPLPPGVPPGEGGADKDGRHPPEQGSEGKGTPQQP
jgi:hypothetical protein